MTGDFDGDGHLDVAELASSPAGIIGVFYNAGGGTFRDETPFGPNPDWNGFGLGVADFNGDGIDDLATTTILRPNASDETVVIEVFTGARDAGFAVATTAITAVPDVHQVATGDFNGGRQTGRRAGADAGRARRLGAAGAGGDLREPG